jgi:hypothetical protein
MQKLLGKNRFNELLSGYIEKPQGKPTLVPDSDKRPALSKGSPAGSPDGVWTVNTAKNDFMEENNHE